MYSIIDAELKRTIEVQNHLLHQLQDYAAKESSNLLTIEQAMKRKEADKVAHLKRRVKQVKLLAHGNF